MVENAKKFKEYTEKENYRFEFFDEDDVTYAKSELQNLENGVNIVFIATFEKELRDTLITGVRFVSGVNANNRSKILEVANKLNDKYLLIKFVVGKNDVKMMLTKRNLENEFYPEAIVIAMSDMCSVAEEVHAEFMKAMWA